MACDLLIVNYGTAEDTLNAILSAKKYLRPILNRVIVVENGTGQAKYFEGKCDVLEFSENLGFARAVNEGMKASIRVKYPPKHVMLLNPDAYLLPGPWLNFFSWIVESVAASGPCILSIDGSVQSSVYTEPVPYKILLELLGVHKLAGTLGYRRNMPVMRTEVDTLQGSCIVVTLDAWKRVGEFDEDFFMYHEETEWCLRAKQKGFMNIYDPSVAVVHKGGTSVPDGRELMYFRSALHLVEKRIGTASKMKLRTALKFGAMVRRLYSMNKIRRENFKRLGQEL